MPSGSILPVKVTTPTGLKFSIVTEEPGAFRIRDVPPTDAITLSSVTPIVTSSMCIAPNLLEPSPRSAP